MEPRKLPTGTSARALPSSTSPRPRPLRWTPLPATAIGGSGTGVSALEMTFAYATLAASGIYREPYTIERADRLSFGETEAVYDHKVEGNRVLSSSQAAATTEFLRSFKAAQPNSSTSTRR